LVTNYHDVSVLKKLLIRIIFSRLVHLDLGVHLPEMYFHLLFTWEPFVAFRADGWLVPLQLLLVLHWMVNQHVLLQLVGFTEALLYPFIITHITVVVPLEGVCADPVMIKIRGCFEGGSTVGADVGSDVLMNTADVVLEIAFLSKPKATNLALEAEFPVMDGLDVPVQVVVSVELFAALGALEFLLIPVADRVVVLHHVVLLAKRLLTVWTWVLPSFMNGTDMVPES